MDKLFFEKRLKSIFRYKKESFNLFKNQMENYYLIKENYKPKKQYPQYTQKQASYNSFDQ